MTSEQDQKANVPPMENGSGQDMTQVLYAEAKSWLKSQRKNLRKYKGQWIAYNGRDGILSHGADASEVIQKAKETGIWHIIKYLHPYVYGGLRRLVSIHFRPLHTDNL